MSWRKHNNAWVFGLPNPEGRDSSLVRKLWGDNHLMLTLEATTSELLYKVNKDKRRVFDLLVDPHWLMFVFGKGRIVRANLKGKRLFMDKHLLVERYGLDPRMYLFVDRAYYRNQRTGS